jgi:predicted methyltransferase
MTRQPPPPAIHRRPWSWLALRLALALLLGSAGPAFLWLGLGRYVRAQREAAPSPTPRPRLAAPLFEPGSAPEKLEGAARDAWQQPRRVVAALRLQPGQNVADVGAGSGYLLPYLSGAVGPRGRVYAEEIQREFLGALRRRARALRNVTVVLGRPDDPGLPPASVDCFVLLTVYHEVEEPVAFLQSLHRAARPNARLAIIDFPPTADPTVPSPPPHQLPEDDVLREARAAGWQLLERHRFLRYQYFLVFGPA